MVGRGDGAFHQTGEPISITISFFLWMSQCFQLPKRDKHSNNKQNKREQTRTTPKTKKNMKDNKKIDFQNTLTSFTLSSFFVWSFSKHALVQWRGHDPEMCSCSCKGVSRAVGDFDHRISIVRIVWILARNRPKGRQKEAMLQKTKGCLQGWFQGLLIMGPAYGKLPIPFLCLGILMGVVWE